MHKNLLRSLNLVFVLALILLSTCSANPTTLIPDKTAAGNFNGIDYEPGSISNVYMPVVVTPPVKFFGIYIKQYWNEQNVITYMPVADQFAGKKHTSVGWFIDLEDYAFTHPETDLTKNNLTRQLENLWQSGYVSFVNLGSNNASAYEIASGARDSEINYAAEFYKDWIDFGGGRKAFIAPLQEMNGDWVSYGQDPENYKLAYRHILDIFAQKGIDRSQVWWVFAPNGWNDPGHEFEAYYPGDDVVDFVSFSSYNYGYCPGTVATSAWWGSYSTVFEPYINRMRVMAPTKKIIVAETATTAYYDYDKSDDNRKNQWLIENYTYLAQQPDIFGVYYFNYNDFDGKVCDFKVDNYSGYADALKNSTYQYLTIQGLERYKN